MNDIFKKRRSAYYTQNLKYLRYVFNDHFVLFIMIILAALAVQYGQFLQHNTLNFWFRSGIVFLVSIICLLFGRLALFSEPADALFLLVKEEEYKAHLGRALWRSLIFPGLLMLVLVGLAVPAVRFDAIAAIVWFGLLLVVKAALLNHQLHQLQPAGHIDWYRLIRYEEERRMRLLKIFANFTSVRGLSSSAKRRKYLDFLLPRRADDTMTYLYWRTFLRSGDYLSLSLRLFVLAALLSAFVDSLIFGLLAVTVINYLLIFQLLALRTAYDHQPLLRIYPEKASSSVEALRKLILKVFLPLLLLEVLLMLLVRFDRALYLLAFVIVSLGLAHVYTQYRLKAKK